MILAPTRPAPTSTTSAPTTATTSAPTAPPLGLLLRNQLLRQLMVCLSLCVCPCAHVPCQSAPTILPPCPGSLSFCLSIVCWSIRLSVFSRSVCLFIYKYVCRSLCLSVCLHVCPVFHLSSVCLSLSLCLPDLSVCFSLRMSSVCPVFLSVFCLSLSLFA